MKVCLLLCCLTQLLCLKNLGKINGKQKNLYKCNRYHFHKSTLADENKNYNKAHKNRHGANSKNRGIFVFFSVLNKGKQKRNYREGNEKSRCNPMGNSFGIPILDAVAESQSNNTNAYKGKNAEEVRNLAFDVVS